MNKKEERNELQKFFEMEAVYINYLREFLHEKSVNYMISRSGSVKGNKNEKNHAGQSYLYKRKGMESEVFEIKMCDRVYGSALQQAVFTALKRYPYLSVKFVEKDGDFYIVKNLNSMLAKETATLKPLGSIRTNYHLIDVNYKKKSIYVSFHHALCDGAGIKPFIETLLYYYCAYRYNRKNLKQPIPNIRLANEKLFEDETKDPFVKEYHINKVDYPKFSRDGFALDENVKTGDTMNYRYEVLVDYSSFLNFAKSNNATPSIALGLVMNQAIKNLYPNFDKPIICNMAANMRSALNCENTFKNCTRSMVFPYSNEFSNLSLSEQATEYRRLMNIQREPDYVKREANAVIGLYNKLDTLNSYSDRIKIMDFFEDMLLNTYIISYLGQFNLGYNEEHIESIHLYNSGVTGLGINMIATNKYFIFDFKQSFNNKRYVNEFANVLKDYNLSCEATDCIPFKTPTDAVIKRKKKDLVDNVGNNENTNTYKYKY